MPRRDHGHPRPQADLRKSGGAGGGRRRAEADRLPLPDALPLVKKVLFSLVKRKDMASCQPPHRRPASPASRSCLRQGRRAPVSIDPHKDVAVQQYTGGTTGLPKGALLNARQYRGKYEPDRQMGMRPVLCALQGGRRAAVLPHLRHDGLHERAFVQWRPGGHAAAVRDEGIPVASHPHPPQCAARSAHTAQCGGARR